MGTRIKGQMTLSTPKSRRRTAGSHRLQEAYTKGSAGTAHTALLRLLGELSDAISLVTVVHHSLASRDASGVGDDEVALRHALNLLRAAHTGLDLACDDSKLPSPSSMR